ncbi:hypothetical protein [Metasolibacillus meyeri]|uniref:hypothetical protein n=1 Tax=Metasolibacillus meyeri TaxID=1071052 RepID=UPI00187D3F34|nr:hypothetical protein [Metasolibacillus meyeri]
MGNDEQQQFEERFERLNDEGKRYILAVLQALEFAQSNQEIEKDDGGGIHK